MCVTIWGVAVYVYDKFEFSDDDFLGYWRNSPAGVSKTWSFGYTKITNKSYRDWRTANSQGADFEIFSDVKYTYLPDAVSFRIP